MEPITKASGLFNQFETNFFSLSGDNLATDWDLPNVAECEGAKIIPVSIVFPFRRDKRSP